MSSHLSVLIVGAGPAGLMMACELARHGISFRIIDKKPEPTLASNATWVQTRTVEILDLVGIGERFVRKGHHCTAINLYAKGKQVVTIPVNQIDSTYQFILMLPQSETEKILNDRLAELHTKVERSIELTNIDQKNNTVVSTVQHPNGRTEIITSDWLIACDGANSTVRGKCGLFFRGEDLSEQFMVADARMSSFLPHDEVHVFFDKGTVFPDKATVFAAFPLGSKEFRINANLHQGSPRQIFTEREVKETVAERTYGNYVVESVSWISPFWMHSKLVEQMRHNSIFFVGDAAHIYPPLGGQGMNAGIQDAYNLAWKLALVIKDKAKPSLLDSYQAERHPVSQEVADQTERFTNMALFDKSFIPKLRKFARAIAEDSSPLLEKMTRQITQLSIHYQNSPVIDYHEPLNSKAPNQGERAPDVVIDQSKRLYDYLRNTQHNVLFFIGTTAENKDVAKITELQQWLKKSYSELIKSHVISQEKITGVDNIILDVNNAIHNRYQAENAGLYIIRPDNYIAYCSKDMDKTTIEKFLQLYFL